MADLRAIVDRASQAHLRLVEGLAQLAVHHARSVVGFWSDVILLPLNKGAGGSAAAAAAEGTAEPRAESAAGPVLGLEGEAGELAEGRFVVSNQLPRRVSAPVGASTFVDPAGREVEPEVTIEPEVVTLDPGGQAQVKVSVPVTEDLVVGVGYRAEISIPGLSDRVVPVVLRRRAPASREPA